MRVKKHCASTRRLQPLRSARTEPGYLRAGSIIAAQQPILQAQHFLHASGQIRIVRHQQAHAVFGVQSQYQVLDTVGGVAVEISGQELAELSARLTRQALRVT
jgi:hypothetical protein